MSEHQLKARQISTLTLPSHEVCNNCRYAVLVPARADMIECYGAPPTPVIMGAGQNMAGQQVTQINAMRPLLPRPTRACGTFRPVEPPLVIGEG